MLNTEDQAQVLDLAVFMHDTYEHLAKQVGWKTQESCQVGFDDLPATNRKVMLSVAHEVLKRLSTQAEELETNKTPPTSK